MKLNSKIKNLAESATLAINNLALEKRKMGERVFNLAAGEPMVETPEVVINAATKAMKNGKTHYPPVLGIPELRTAAAEWINKNYQTNFTTEETIVTCGGKHALAMTLEAILDPGNEAIIISPYWVSYPTMVEKNEGVVRIVETQEKNNWKVKIEDLEKSCTDKTKVLLFNNAANPTGVLYEKNEVEAILKFAKEKNIIVISDEVYSGLVYDDKKFTSAGSFAEHKNNVVIIQSASKSFAMTGWRVGLVFGEIELIKALKKLQSQTTSGTSSISQWAALAALQNSEEITKELKKEMQKRRDFFVDNFFTEINKPQAGLYSFISLQKFGIENNNSVEFCKKVLQEKNIAMVPGAPFGAEGFVRISFGVEIEELKGALSSL